MLCCLKNKKGVGMSFNLRISESICLGNEWDADERRFNGF